MSFTLYDASIPVMLRSLGQLASLLEKAAAHAEERKIDPSIFVNARLAPDMYPLARQVQSASDAAKACAARLAGLENPSFPDTETTFPELQERIAKTVTFLKSVDPALIAGQEGREIVMKRSSGDIHFTGASYVQGMALPNFFFHVVTAYDILRHNGLAIGKLDYLGRP
ncbi:hypothetical protein GCM10011611_21850 [Aliidongia dinghuensis]|uniref:DUF1993 domain-containing protein n=1 Tax=Aliidongia dinghuensis TaxID=1867774 RepID=A0A8J2YSJ2_9PROT|nr:DUF1993 domain-containing protein [Aliidongia dinghuensis]GGF15689.1 hypothetical protein GCM10011611_21850 [Aliidongia dinghuensis]